MNRKDVPIGQLVGEVIETITGLEKGSDRVEFHCLSGRLFTMLHHQDCCESVNIEDVEGDVADLLGSPVLVAEVADNIDEPYAGDDSYTWTFYRIATAKGWVVIRWLGESNGYYSESVDFELRVGDYEPLGTSDGWVVLYPDGRAPLFPNREAAEAAAALAQSVAR